MTDHIAKIGDDMSAVWIIRSVGSHRPSEQWTSACRRTLNVLGALFLEETGNLDRFNHLIVPEVWIDHIRTEGTHLLSSGVMASAVYRSDEYDDCTKIGLGLVILGILDVFHELVPSAKIS